MRQRINKGRHMAHTRQEVEQAFRHYWTVGAIEERWHDWHDVFTEDVVYVEHIYGTMHGRDAVKTWIRKVMANNLHVHAVLDWYMIEGDRVVLSMQNRMYNPEPGGADLDFPGITVLGYAGNGLFNFEEDYWDLRLAKKCYAQFTKAAEQFGTEHIQETAARMRARHPWPSDP